MSFGIFETQIYNLLNDNKATLDVNEVQRGPQMNFSGYPAINITPADNESGFETTTENMRVYTFDVTAFYETKDTTLNGAINSLEEIVDGILNILDEEDLNSSNTIGQSGLPATYTYLFMRANPSSWGKTEDEALVFAQIRVALAVSVDVS